MRRPAGQRDTEQRPPRRPAVELGELAASPDSI